MKMTYRQAQNVPWCQVAEGVIHVADWVMGSDGGGLTTLTEEPDPDAPSRKTVCYAQTLITFAVLVETGTLWRDRAALARREGFAICLRCVADVQLDEDIRDVNR